MSLDNWVEWALFKDGHVEEGQGIVPTVRSRTGVAVSIYKDRIHVYDEEGWTPACFSRPMVMCIEDANLIHYKDVSISASYIAGHPGGAVCVLAWTIDCGRNFSVDNVMMGVGAFGDEEGARIPEHGFDWLSRHLSNFECLAIEVLPESGYESLTEALDEPHGPYEFCRKIRLQRC